MLLCWNECTNFLVCFPFELLFTGRLLGEINQHKLTHGLIIHGLHFVLYLQVVKLVRAIRAGLIRFDKPKEEPSVHLLWGDESNSTEKSGHLAYIPAPKPKLPGNANHQFFWSVNIHLWLSCFPISDAFWVKILFFLIKKFCFNFYLLRPWGVVQSVFRICPNTRRN